MRLFVAVEVPRVGVPGLLFEAGEAPVHVTLKFLGEVEPARVPELAQALDRALVGAHGGKATLEGMGGFPNRERPRVLWIGITQGREIFRDLQERVEGALSGMGFPKEERPFHPHMTVARPKGPAQLEEARRALRENEGRVFAAFEVKDVLLKRSVLAPSGAVHTTLVSLPLGPPVS